MKNYSFINSRPKKPRFNAIFECNKQCAADEGGKHIFKLACVINGAFGSIIYASLINYAD